MKNHLRWHGVSNRPNRFSTSSKCDMKATAWACDCLCVCPCWNSTCSMVPCKAAEKTNSVSYGQNVLLVQACLCLLNSKPLFCPEQINKFIDSRVCSPIQNSFSGRKLSFFLFLWLSRISFEFGAVHSCSIHMNKMTVFSYRWDQRPSFAPYCELKMHRKAITKQYRPRCYCNQRFNVSDTHPTLTTKTAMTMIMLMIMVMTMMPILVHFI